MKNKILPIGSIITINNQDLMICSYLKKDTNINNKQYDYLCCIYPNGIGKESFFVNKLDIDRIKFIGYQNKNFFELVNKMETEND